MALLGKTRVRFLLSKTVWAVFIEKVNFDDLELTWLTLTQPFISVFFFFFKYHFRNQSVAVKALKKV